MYLTDVTISCGIQQFEGLSSSPRENLQTIGRQIYKQSRPCAFVIWSDVWGRNQRGNKLYHYIRKIFPRHSIQRTTKAKNPSSGNQICVYTWKVPKRFEKWWKKEFPNDDAATNFW